MSFPLGKAVAAMICLAVLVSPAVLFRPSPRHADLRMWVFAEPHARMYRGNPDAPASPNDPTLCDRFTARTRKTASIEVVATQALDVRLLSLFMSGQNSPETPDLAEIEINSVGKYLRPPAKDVGFLPLNGYLEKSGWINRILPSRLAPWSKDGLIFGVPHDLHPSTITYRKDLFEEAGVELDSVKTWPEFQERALKFQQYWAAHGYPRRLAIGLSTTLSDNLVTLLQQRHINIVDPDLSVHMLDPKVLSTLVWYAQAVAGPRKIGTDLNTAPGQYVRDIATGEICGIVTPDWMVGYLKLYAPDALYGRVRMIPIPRFDADDAPTSTWGGTMLGITKHCKNPDLAWKLIETLYLDREALHVQQQQTSSSILPPIPEYWSDPFYQQPDAFYGGQRINQLYLSLAAELPRRYVTPYTTMAHMVLAVVVSDAVSYVNHHGSDGLEAACRQWLTVADHDVRETIEFDKLGRRD
jgi:arabinosaccharide transport system substrate-binding protein